LGLLADLEVAAGNAEGALTLIDNGLAMAQEGGQHYADSFLNRLRGDILLKRDPADPAPAEEAYRNAIAIAKQQGARSYELRARALACEALPIDRPPGRCSGGPRARPRRVFADVGNARDRGGTGAVGGY
jgi:hypothetical protein